MAVGGVEREEVKGCCSTHSFRHMSVEEKQPFLDMAETLKRQHHLDHPDYKFKPKQRSTATSTATATNKSTLKKISSLNGSSLRPTDRSIDVEFRLGQRALSSVTSLSPMSNLTSHPVQSNVLAMCQAIIPTPTSPTLASPATLNNACLLYTSPSPRD